MAVQFAHKPAGSIIGSGSYVFRHYGEELVTWAKYSCDFIEAYYEEKPNDETIGTSAIFGTYYGTSVPKATVYTGYSFTPESGYTGTGGVSVEVNAATNYYYRASAKQINKIDSYSQQYVNSSMGYKYQFLGYVDAVAAYYPESYNKGAASFGTIIGAKNELPEDGTLIAGTVDGDYCVVDVGGTYYYYERV